MLYDTHRVLDCPIRACTVRAMSTRSREEHQALPAEQLSSTLPRRRASSRFTAVGDSP
jgi:hypothetical protein